MEYKYYIHKNKRHIVQVVLEVYEYTARQAQENIEGSLIQIISQRQFWAEWANEYRCDTFYRPFAMEKDTFLEVYEEL